ncbi:MAG: biosynthetic peptidoglycan transglycosylase [Kofleriaceae bacterium]
MSVAAAMVPPGPALRLWRLLRPPVAAALLVLVVMVELAVVASVAWPVDAAALRADARAPGWVPLDEIPAVATAAVIEAEDDGFWDHRGVELRGAVRAAVLDARAGRIAFGGSTLSMQVARLIYTRDQPRSLARKLHEAALALRLERLLTKRELLEQWWNRADFGNGAVGVGAAARRYFGKPVAALTTGEATLLACLPRAPTAYDPYRHLDAAVARRARVLALLVRRGHLERAAAEAASRPPALAPAAASDADRDQLVRLVGVVVARRVAPR